MSQNRENGQEMNVNGKNLESVTDYAHALVMIIGYFFL